MLKTLSSFLKNKTLLKNECLFITKCIGSNFSTEEIQVHRANLFEYEKQRQVITRS